MKVELEIDDLKSTIDGLNNAIIAYADIRNSIWLMGGIPSDINQIWGKLLGNSLETLTEKFDIRLTELKNIYNQLIEKEKEIKNDKRTEIGTYEG